MKTYIINLTKDKDRRKNMETILAPYKKLSVEYIEAVDGRSLSENELSRLFNQDKFSKTHINSATTLEIGCVSSHHKCYKKLLESNEKYALILEDDISKPDEDFSAILAKIEVGLSNTKPRIILLSDWFWYTRSNPFLGKHKIAKVYAGFLAHAYIINRAGAELLTRELPSYIADDWATIRRKGIEISAIIPHIIQQNWTKDFKSSIQQPPQQANNCSFHKMLRALMWQLSFLRQRIPMAVLKLTGHYYAPHQSKSEWEKSTAGNSYTIVL